MADQSQTPELDQGFSLIELMVVMIVIGILAAVAIPIYLHQRQASHDAAVRSDTMNLGQEVFGYWHNEPPVTSVELIDGKYYVNHEYVMEASDGVELVTYDDGGTAGAQAWCLQLRHPDGDVSVSPGVSFNAREGYVENAAC